MTSVKVISYPNTSVLVSWKPPRSAPEEVQLYIVAIANNSLAAYNPFTCFALDTKNSSIYELTYASRLYDEFSTNKTEKLFDKSKYHLKSGDTYIFFIFALGEHGFGIE